MTVVNVKKQDGRLEEFDRDKLKTSMTKAGVTEANAAKVTNTIASRMREGIQTEDIRRQVVTELERVEPKATQSYEELHR